MAFYLLDTNHTSPLVTQDHVMGGIIARRRIAGDRLGIATPALAEMFYGILLLPRATTNLQEWKKYADTFDYYSVDREIAEQSAQLRVELRKKGKQLAAMDAMIAMVALRHNLILVTTDQDFSAVPGLHIENWLS